MPFPARGDTFPTKDDVADCLESYARRFHLPVQNGVKVDTLERRRPLRRQRGQPAVRVGQSNLRHGQLPGPQSPAFASELDHDIVQLHSHEYRNPSQLRDGSVLIVGVGNSGADIGIEVARTHPTCTSGKETGHVPFRIESALWRFFLVRLLRFFGHYVLTVDTPIGRKLGLKIISRGRTARPGETLRPDQCTIRARPPGCRSAELANHCWKAAKILKCRT